MDIAGSQITTARLTDVGWWILLVFAPTICLMAQSGISHPRTAPRLAEASGDERAVVNSNLITMKVSVTDSAARPVPGLPQSAFTILDNQVPQDITFFGEEAMPVSVGLVFDLSASMQAGKRKRAQAALGGLIETSHPEDEFFLIGFNDQAQLLIDRTRDSQAVVDKLTSMHPRGQTALYDAVHLGVERVTRGTRPQRNLLIISDGDDNRSRYTIDALRALLKEADVTIYAVGILGPQYAARLRGDRSGQDVLEELTSMTGGKAFFPKDKAEIQEAFEKIALQMRHQYSVGYRPADFTPNGKWHRLQVKVSIPSDNQPLLVRARKGYYAFSTPASSLSFGAATDQSQTNESNPKAAK